MQCVGNEGGLYCGFSMPWTWEGFTIYDKKTQYCGLTSMQKFAVGEDLIMS